MARIRYLICGVCLLLAAYHSAAAQPTTGPNVFVSANDGKTTRILSFTGGSPGANVVVDPAALPPDADPGNVYISPDGQWIFSTTKDNRLFYLKAGQQAPEKPRINSPWWSVSADSRYLFFVSIEAGAKGPEEAYNLLELATGVRIQLTAKSVPKVAFPPQDFVAPVVDWTLLNNRLVLLSLQPSPDGGLLIPGKFIAVDLSGIDLTQPGRYPLPAPTELPKGGQYIGQGYLSPDGTKLAYIYLDDTKQPARNIRPNYRFLSPSNSVAILDLATGKQDTIQAGGNDVITSISWKADGKALVYAKRTSTADKYAYQVHTYDLGLRQDNAGPVLLSDVQSGLFTVEVCGPSLFFLTQNRLYYTPLDGSAGTIKLLEATEIHLLSCAPAEAWKADRVIAIATPQPNATAQTVVPDLPTLAGSTVDVKTLDLSGGDPVAGKQLYIALGCAACHDAGAIAPPTAGMRTRIVNERLKDPANANKTPEQYIAESILQPSAYVVPHFPAGIEPRDYGNKVL